MNNKEFILKIVIPITIPLVAAIIFFLLVNGHQTEIIRAVRAFFNTIWGTAESRKQFTIIFSVTWICMMTGIYLIKHDK